ncbi:MAG TPA: hypothetical protein VKJ45_01755 [Blastocatellia bacterium]|nr:hypothetical protein [Blastocatellia bacterium]
MVKRAVISVFLGVMFTAGLRLLSFDGLLGSPFAQIFLFPATVLLWAVGPGPNIGGPEHPMHEITPVHLIAGLAGLGISALMYSGLIYLLLKKIAPQWN